MAIERWRLGDSAPVERLLRGAEPVPADARLWLVEALAGRDKRRRGRRPQDETAREIFDAYRVKELYAAQLAVARATKSTARDGTPTDRALAATAAQLRMTEDAVSRIVHPRRERAARIPGHVYPAETGAGDAVPRPRRRKR